MYLKFTLIFVALSTNCYGSTVYTRSCVIIFRYFCRNSEMTRYENFKVGIPEQNFKNKTVLVFVTIVTFYCFCFIQERYFH